MSDVLKTIIGEALRALAHLVIDDLAARIQRLIDRIEAWFASHATV